MKKVKFILPVVAIMFAVVGVFATADAKLTLVDGPVTADPADDCPFDGNCTGSTPTQCKIESTNLQFYVRSGTPVTCLVAASGKFAQP